VIGSFFNPLARRPKAGHAETMERPKAATRALLDLSDDVVVSVTEITCRKSGCPDVETVVAALRAGEPCTAKFRKPLRGVRAGTRPIAPSQRRSESSKALGSRSP
jgi:hypothetical protein